MSLRGGGLEPFYRFGGIGCHDGTGDVHGAQSVLGIGVSAFGLFGNLAQDCFMSCIFLLLSQTCQGQPEMSKNCRRHNVGETKHLSSPPRTGTHQLIEADSQCQVAGLT